MPVYPLGPVNMVGQSMTLPVKAQGMFEGGMKMQSQGMDGRKNPAGFSFSNSVTYVNSGNGQFVGTTFVFTATSTQEGDWMVVAADGVNATSVTGGSGVSWTKLTLTNVGAYVTTVFYRRLEAGDAGATFTINGGTSTGPAEWAAYRGVASVGAPQTQVSLASASDLTFSAVSPANKSGRLLAIVSEHGTAGAGSWTAPSGWNTRVSWNAYGPKYLGDILSQTYANQGGPIVFQTSVTQAAGQVGWLFELVGT